MKRALPWFLYLVLLFIVMGFLVYKNFIPPRNKVEISGWKDICVDWVKPIAIGHTNYPSPPLRWIRQPRTVW